MAYDYSARRVEVGPLGAQRHPARYDLCETHATGLTPPRGWRVDVEPGCAVVPHAAVSGVDRTADDGAVRRSATG